MYGSSMTQLLTPLTNAGQQSCTRWELFTLTSTRVQSRYARPKRSHFVGFVPMTCSQTRCGILPTHAERVLKICLEMELQSVELQIKDFDCATIVQQNMSWVISDPLYRAPEVDMGEYKR